MGQEDEERMIDVENGRLNVLLREILADLGVATSEVHHDGDTIIDIERRADGRMQLLGTEPGGATPAEVEDMLPVCWWVVAGTNVVGTVSVRMRHGGNGPEFVAVAEEP